MCICVHEKEEWQQWTRDTNKKKKKREREREREREEDNGVFIVSYRTFRLNFNHAVSTP